jgi:RNA polymerase sigma-70 factor (ECF subfamily)
VGEVTADAEVLRQLHDEHAAALHGFALRATRDPHQAQDVVQEVLLRAWRHPEALAPERGSVRAWLMTLARNVVVDQHRRRGARPPEVAFEGSAAEAAATPVNELDRAMESWLVAEALRRLTPDHRHVLVELYYKDKSVADAARTLGIPAGTVKSRAFYALRALRVVLQEQGVVA